MSALRIILSQHLQAGSHPWSLGFILSPAWLADIASELLHI